MISKRIIVYSGLLISCIAGIAMINMGTLYSPIFTQKKKPNVVFVAIPKSASHYIWLNLASHLGYEPINVHHSSDYNDFFKFNQAVSRSHFSRRKSEISSLKKYTNKIVVHFRDPRQIVLSYAHYANKRHKKNKPMLKIPDSYYELSLTQQIDWVIENRLPKFLKWEMGWLSFIDEQRTEPNGMKILVTTYEQFLEDEEGLYRRIAHFYNLPLKRIVKTDRPDLDKLNFRSGNPNEWRTVYTDEQKEKIAQMMPTELFNRFGWTD